MDYLKKLQNALIYSLNQSNLYRGKEGALRLAREIGSILKELDDKTANEYFNRSYNEICVIGYNLKPPVNKKEWDKEILKKWKGNQNVKK